MTCWRFGWPCWLTYIQVGCILSSSQGCLAWVLGKPGTRLGWLWPIFPRASEGRPLGPNPRKRTKVYRLAPDAPAFRGIPTGPKAFLRMPGVSGQQPCAWAHLHSSGWWGVRQIKWLLWLRLIVTESYLWAKYILFKLLVLDINVFNFYSLVCLRFIANQPLQVI